MAESPQRQRGGKLTPMLAQYLELKSQHPDAILLFRMGDFYETFFEDAELLSRVAGVTLTSRDARSEHPVPLAGVPYHALDTYLHRLLGHGLTVAICEQVEDPALAKGLVKREVVEIISPGTATAPELLGEASSVYCLAYLPATAAPAAQARKASKATTAQKARGTTVAGWALLDASTGEFRCGQEEVALRDLCERYPVREVIIGENTAAEDLRQWRKALPELVINPVSATWFHPAFAARTLQDHFQVKQLTAFGLAEEDRSAAVAAAGALLRYLGSLNLARPAQVATLRFAAREDRLLLDEETLRNLEVFRTFRGETKTGTLVHHVDTTCTAMGRRLLERRLAEPLTEIAELKRWHEGVAAAITARDWRTELRGILDEIGDLDRLAARAASGRIGPAQLVRLGRSLTAVVHFGAAVLADGRSGHPLCDWATELPDLAAVASGIAEGLQDEAPAKLRQGGVMRPGVDNELDQCRNIAADTKGFLAGLQNQERAATGISTLKIGYNKVFGYYFEVTNKHLDKVPEHYVQKQTLVNACRYHTDQLKEAEDKILAAEERAEELEKRLYTELVAAVGEKVAEIYAASRLCASSDLLLAFATLAEQRNYCQPECDDGLGLHILQGRHPVIEQLLDSDFIPNDTLFDGEQNQLLLLTGPNMGGKSTYLRQVALIVLLAQTGSFVPATSARVGVADRIFTRVGASDNLARGESTFYTEMSETAHILHQMSRRSLVVLDEIGRGTSTYDGLSLAWAITEYLVDSRGPRPRTVFATHYHELTELEASLAGLINLKMAVREWEGKIIFLHAVKAGRSDKSYGIHVARLAGIPAAVLRRAEVILSQLTLADRRGGLGSGAELDPGTASAPAGGASLVADTDLAREVRKTGVGLGGQQLSLFSDGERDALDALRDLDLDRISPVDAFMWLVKIRSQLPDK